MEGCHLMQSFLKKKSQSYLARYPKVFFCHIPKCAGVSLSNAIYASLYPKVFKASRFASHIDLFGSRVSAELLDIDMMLARESELIFQLSDKYQIFTTGHCKARPNVVDKFKDDWNFVTILREPSKRFVSEYVYNKFKSSNWVKNSDEISIYLESEKALLSSTTYARFFSHFSNPTDILNNEQEAIESAISNLKNFAVSGSLENLDSWQSSFNAKFDTKIRIENKNSSPNKSATQDIYEDNDVMQSIQQLNKIDQAIYESVVKG